MLRAGLVVLDTNVLVNLYRFTEQARDDLLGVLKQLDGRLWLPHQVLVEFWRNRDTVLRDPRDTDGLVNAREKRRRPPLRRCRRGRDRRRCRRSGRMRSPARSARRSRRRPPVSAPSPTERRRVRRGTPPVTRCSHGWSRCSPVLSARRSTTKRRPPPMRRAGAGSSPGAAWVSRRWKGPGEGDRRLSDLGAVAGGGRGGAAATPVRPADVRDDWWRTGAEEPRGPQLSLARELRARSGGRLFMLTPARFLTTAQSVFGVTVHEASVEQATEAERVTGQREEENRRSPNVQAVTDYWSDYLSDNARTPRRCPDRAARRAGLHVRRSRRAASGISAERTPPLPPQQRSHPQSAGDGITV